MVKTIVRTDEVIGVNVKNAQGENLGKIEEIVLDKLTGEARYVVLSFGGILGMGDKLFALPWNAIHYNDNHDCFMLSIDKEKLKMAPGFDKDHWPDMANTTWSRSIYSFYGLQDKRRAA